MVYAITKMPTWRKLRGNLWIAGGKNVENKGRRKRTVTWRRIFGREISRGDMYTLKLTIFFIWLPSFGILMLEPTVNLSSINGVSMPFLPGQEGSHYRRPTDTSPTGCIKTKAKRKRATFQIWSCWTWRFAEENFPVGGRGWNSFVWRFSSMLHFTCFHCNWSQIPMWILLESHLWNSLCFFGSRKIKTKIPEADDLPINVRPKSSPSTRSPVGHPVCSCSSYFFVQDLFMKLLNQHDWNSWTSRGSNQRYWAKTWLAQTAQQFGLQIWIAVQQL